jgi:hypothetical protein
VRSFFAYGPNFSGGVFVAAGDVNGDGRDDIITGAGSGAPGGHVKVFDGRTGVEVRSFFAFPGFTGGVTVAAGDVNGDGTDDIITGAGPGAGPHVKVFDGRTNAERAGFFAYGQGFVGGVFVAAGDVDGDGRADIVTGADGAPGGHVKAFSGATGAEIRSFFAFGPNFSGGVRVAAGDVNGDGLADIVTGAGPGAGPHVRVFDGRTHTELRSFLAFDPSFAGGVFVAAGDLNGGATPRRLDLDLAIDTAGGADALDVQLGATASDELLQKVRIATGDGADRARVVWSKPRLGAPFPSQDAADQGITTFAQIDAAIDTGRGDDLLLTDVLSFEVRTLRSDLRFDTGAGDDTSRFTIDAGAVPRSQNQSIHQLNFLHDAGAGNDNVEVDVRPPRNVRYSWAYQLRLGQGRDVARYWVFGTELPPAADGPGGLLDSGRLAIEIDGEAGDDRVSLDFRGPILREAAVDAVLRGGAGNDQVRARFDLSPGSTGKLSAQVLGDEGNDELGLAVLNADALDLLFALLDGGAGRDRCRTTPNVVVKNCP